MNKFVAGANQIWRESLTDIWEKVVSLLTGFMSHYLQITAVIFVLDSRDTC